jgi:hypothetical protein|uniref:Uncharacterized protein n=1 Tax=Eutreptiella gymnastica TaxID=73025 RepID=A0A7S4FXV5_9EUGL|mmetsp:Transcript_87243/g.145525  ORF Transcript_87243/g.145525 Transcript_87243/m.145525 type:complete len:137 (-) Transcript_87243:240-650(-)
MGVSNCQAKSSTYRKQWSNLLPSSSYSWPLHCTSNFFRGALVVAIMCMQVPVDMMTRTVGQKRMDTVTQALDKCLRGKGLGSKRSKPFPTPSTLDETNKVRVPVSKGGVSVRQGVVLQLKGHQTSLVKGQCLRAFV